MRSTFTVSNPTPGVRENYCGSVQRLFHLLLADVWSRRIHVHSFFFGILNEIHVLHGDGTEEDLGQIELSPDIVVDAELAGAAVDQGSHGQAPDFPRIQIPASNQGQMNFTKSRPGWPRSDYLHAGGTIALACGLAIVLLCRKKSWNSPFVDDRDLKSPVCAIFPASKTNILSAFFRVVSRWAIVMTVLWSNSLSIFRWIMASFVLSSAEVASSKMIN